MPPITVSITNPLYLIMIGLLIFLVILGCVFLPRLPRRINFWLLFSLTIASFSLHFLKQFAYVADWPRSFAKSTAENLCAFATMVFPWFFLFGGKIAKDYMYYVGILSGLAVILFPTDLVGLDLGIAINLFEFFRFYFCHFVLLLVGFFTVFLGFHKLDYRRIWRVAIMFLAVMVIILLNELVLMGTGIIDATLDEFLSRDFRNASFVFGPNSTFDSMLGWAYNLVPFFFRIHPYDPGRTFFFPVLWVIFPFIFFLYPIGFLMGLPFDFRHFKYDMQVWQARIKIRQQQRHLKRHLAEIDQYE